MTIEELQTLRYYMETYTVNELRHELNKTLDEIGRLRGELQFYAEGYTGPEKARNALGWEVVLG